ncbi:MFS transporter [Noviherbaspirillum sedimenti]|uniref:MFS transporter n=1 Tax=Noviherbaspirillum sedimenti TaxID=2320865 RepID=A0A3A3G2B6_9BURK|nr:MFS transporter [Noviherbaspirillum sedimenti]RJG00622.1 MFS transporter [Noviherbaspirillum sedimenti]
MRNAIAVKSIWPTMFAFSAVGMLASADMGMMFAAIATFITQFHDPERAGWLITAPMLVSAASAAIGGRMGDLYGRRRVLLVVLTLVTAGAAISGARDDYQWVMLGRVLQGVIGAALPLCYGLLTETMPKARLSHAVSMMTVSTSVGAGLGGLLGGLIVDHLAWQWLFHALAIGGIMASCLVLLLVPSGSVRRKDEEGVDIVGGLLFVPAIVGILLALTQGARWGWGNARALLLLCGSVLLLAVWIRHELRHPRPLIDVRQFANREIATANIIVALLSMGPYQAQIQILLMQQPVWTGVGLGISATLAGTLRMPVTVFGSFGATWSGRLISTYGVHRALICGLSITTAGWGVLILFHDSLVALLGSMFVSIFGICMVLTSVQSQLVHAAPGNRTSEATGLTAVVRYASQAFGTQLLTLVMASSVISDPSKGAGAFPTEVAYKWAFGIITVFCFLCFPIVLAIPRRKVDPDYEVSGEAVLESKN